MSFRALGLALVSISTAASAAGEFITTNSAIYQTLTPALMAHAKSNPPGLSADADTVRVKNEKGEVRIECNTTKKTCTFAPFDGSAHNLRRLADQVVFDALHAAALTQFKEEGSLELSTSGNRNRTFVEVRAKYAPNWKIKEWLRCDSTPKTGGGFDYASCKFHVARIGDATAAAAWLEKLKKSSDIKDRLNGFTADKGWVLQNGNDGLKLVEFYDYEPYKWKELHITFGRTVKPTMNGDLASLTMHVFINGERTDGKVIVESVFEHHNHYMIIDRR